MMGVLDIQMGNLKLLQNKFTRKVESLVAMLV